MHADPESYFPADYRQARRNFIAAATARGIDVITRVHPSARGPDGKKLFLDTAAIGPRDAAKALLLISGTHGVEGYFGSGVQTGLLREGLAPPEGARIVLLHALNPYGFAWNRRVNEDNVDLNRNFVDHANPPDNPDYELIADAVAPRGIDAQSIAAADQALADYRANRPPGAFQAAVSRGQYRHPDGLLYGGQKECWSLAMLRAVLAEDLSRAAQLVAIDFHTGLGEVGQGEMITGALPGSLGYARARAIWGEKVKSSEAGESVSAPLTGTIDQAVAAWMPQAEVTFATLEVGTTPLAQVFDALRRDNWLHNFAGDPDPALAGGIARACRDAFYLGTPDWKRGVYALAQAAVAGALAAL
jgi:hypothetical protein